MWGKSTDYDDTCCCKMNILIRKQREEREAERQSRLRLAKRLEVLRPTASVSGKQDCAETTPVMFDIVSLFSFYGQMEVGDILTKHLKDFSFNHLHEYCIPTNRKHLMNPLHRLFPHSFPLTKKFCCWLFICQVMVKSFCTEESPRV